MSNWFDLSGRKSIDIPSIPLPFSLIKPLKFTLKSTSRRRTYRPRENNFLEISRFLFAFIYKNPKTLEDNHNATLLQYFPAPWFLVLQVAGDLAPSGFFQPPREHNKHSHQNIIPTSFNGEEALLQSRQGWQPPRLRGFRLSTTKYPKGWRSCCWMWI